MAECVVGTVICDFWMAVCTQTDEEKDAASCHRAAARSSAALRHLGGGDLLPVRSTLFVPKAPAWRVCASGRVGGYGAAPLALLVGDAGLSCLLRFLGAGQRSAHARASSSWCASDPLFKRSTVSMSAACRPPPASAPAVWPRQRVARAADLRSRVDLWTGRPGRPSSCRAGLVKHHRHRRCRQWVHRQACRTRLPVRVLRRSRESAIEQSASSVRLARADSPACVSPTAPITCCRRRAAQPRRQRRSECGNVQMACRGTFAGELLGTLARVLGEQRRVSVARLGLDGQVEQRVYLRAA
jgi:hypothetical protein